MPLVLLTPYAGEEALEAMEKSHVLVPRGLRHEVPVWVGIRTDIWEAYQARD